MTQFRQLGVGTDWFVYNNNLGTHDIGYRRCRSVTVLPIYTRNVHTLESVLPSFHVWYRADPSPDTIYVTSDNIDSNQIFSFALLRKNNESNNNCKSDHEPLDKCAFTIDGRALIFKLLGVDLMVPLGLLFCIVRVMGLISTAWFSLYMHKQNANAVPVFPARRRYPSKYGLVVISMCTVGLQTCQIRVPAIKNRLIRATQIQKTVARFEIEFSSSLTFSFSTEISYYNRCLKGSFSDWYMF